METILKKLHTKINRRIGKAIQEYDMIRDGNRIAVAVSGGKDSLTLLHYLALYQKKAPIRFELLAIHIDQSGNHELSDTVQRFCDENKIRCHIRSQNIFEIIETKLHESDTPCSLCSRLRRGLIYTVMREQNCDVLALGHHRDDLIETFLMYSFFNGKLGSMSPHYQTEDDDIRVIRPLYSVPEQWILRFVEENQWKTVTCEFCKAERGFKRKRIKSILLDLENEFPDVKNSIMGALKNAHLEELPDSRHWKGRSYSLPNEEV